MHKLIIATLAALTLAAPLAASAAPIAEATGTFVSGAHDTKGNATIYKLDNGSRVLRLENFATSNGPAVHVYLSAADKIDGNGDVTKGKFVDLGEIKGNTGNQNYTIPTDINAAEYHSVSIWCSRFSVNFGDAILK